MTSKGGHNAASGRVIELIEDRISSAGDSRPVQLRPAEAVYEIHARLEAAFHFRRRFLGH